MKRVCVFCGSSKGNSEVFTAAARTLGETLAARGIELVFGGSHVGLMGVVADAVLANGGKVTGVLPRFMEDKELAHPKLTKLHIVETMHERKQLMAELAEGFIALPGGFVRPTHFNKLVVAATPAELLDRFGQFRPDKAGKWIPSKLI